MADSDLASPCFGDHSFGMPHPWFVALKHGLDVGMLEEALAVAAEVDDIDATGLGPAAQRGGRDAQGVLDDGSGYVFAIVIGMSQDVHKLLFIVAMLCCFECCAGFKVFVK